MKMCPHSPFAMQEKPTVRQTTASAIMNISPPIVGVPVLLMCHVGPSSRIDCPALILRRYGTKTAPAALDMQNPTTSAKISFQVILFPRAFPLLLCQVRFARSARWSATISRSSMWIFSWPMIW